MNHIITTTSCALRLTSHHAHTARERIPQLRTSSNNMDMRVMFITMILLLFSIMASAQTKITLTVDGRTATATLADNAACSELAALLEKGPISISMSDYGGFEKVGSLPQSFPTSDSPISTVAGDIMLYQGNQMVIFYGTNSWDYTRLGKIDNATAESVRQFLGSGNISLSISLQPNSGIEKFAADKMKSDKVYDLNGRLVASRPLAKGIYIVNGHKIFVN